MAKAREKELNKYGVTPSHSAVLYAINSIGSSVTISKLSKWLLREPHSISAILNRMEKAGLIKVSKGKGSIGARSIVRITITNKGKQVYGKVIQRESTHQILSVLSEEERLQLKSLLLKLRDRAISSLWVKHTKPPFP